MRQDDIRKEILLQLYATRPIALTAERIQRDAKKQAYDYSLTEVKQELQFLADEGLIFVIEDKGATTRLYRIHASGVRHYEQNFAA